MQKCGKLPRFNIDYDHREGLEGPLQYQKVWIILIYDALDAVVEGHAWKCHATCDTNTHSRQWNASPCRTFPTGNNWSDSLQGRKSPSEYSKRSRMSIKMYKIDQNCITDNRRFSGKTRPPPRLCWSQKGVSWSPLFVCRPSWRQWRLITPRSVNQKQPDLATS